MRNYCRGHIRYAAGCTDCQMASAARNRARYREGRTVCPLCNRPSVLGAHDRCQRRARSAAAVLCACGTRIKSRNGVTQVECSKCRRRKSGHDFAYGHAHKMRRRAALAAMKPGDTCARCRIEIHPWDDLHLDHTDDRLGYLGLSHAYCNVTAHQSRRRSSDDKAVSGV